MTNAAIPHHWPYKNDPSKTLSKRFDPFSFGKLSFSIFKLAVVYLALAYVAFAYS